MFSQIIWSSNKLPVSAAYLRLDMVLTYVYGSPGNNRKLEKFTFGRTCMMQTREFRITQKNNLIGQQNNLNISKKKVFQVHNL